MGILSTEIYIAMETYLMKESFRKRNCKLTREHRKRRNISVTEEGMHYNENVQREEGFQRQNLHIKLKNHTKRWT
jgi:hypothetical protein